jgi:hypothetical protein
MNRRKLETLLLTLESTPAMLARAVEDLSPSEVRRKPQAGGFSFLENVWHLADLEREGYGIRIRRILTEEEPSLSDFDGDRVARERRYNERDLAEGLIAFTQARARNVEALRRAARSQWKRHATQEGVGRVTLEDVPRQMTCHDAAHTREIRDLLSHLRDGTPYVQQQSSAGLTGPWSLVPCP